MSFGEAIQSGFKNYANFHGRAARSEYNYWILFGILISIITMILDITFFPLFSIDGTGPLNAISGIVFLIPNFSIGIRRLHDINKSGWNILWALTFIGIFPLIYWNYFKAGDEGENLYGPDPLG
tara:strand:+ start:2436 stop:2807 length:372 start_codon:yes stop_codon:yes gene_type:complete